VPPYQILKQIKNIYNIQYGGHTIEDDLDFKILISQIHPFKITGVQLLRWMKILHQSKWDYEILYADRLPNDEQLLVRTFF
jgi:hypothetical protein